MKKISRYFLLITGIYFFRKLLYERNFYKDELYRFSMDTWEWVENNCSDIQIESYLLRKHLKNKEVNK